VKNYARDGYLISSSQRSRGEIRAARLLRLEVAEVNKGAEQPALFDCPHWRTADFRMDHGGRNARPRRTPDRPDIGIFACHLLQKPAGRQARAWHEDWLIGKRAHPMDWRRSRSRLNVTAENAACA